jgi:hypothetical protein
MKKSIAAIVLLLLMGGRSVILAAESPNSGPCAPLPAASSADFEPFLEKFMNAFCYRKQNWNHDAQVRTSNGVHPYVKVWYSPSLWNWLTTLNRQGEVPNGAMLVKEQYVSLTAPLREDGIGRICRRRPNPRCQHHLVANRRSHSSDSVCIA